MHGGHDVATRPVIAIDAMLADQSLDVADGGLGELHELGGARLAEEHEQRRQILADRRREMAGIAAARAEPGEVPLEHDDIDARALQRQGRGEPGVAGADDRNVGRNVAGDTGPQIGRGRDPRTDRQVGWMDAIGRPLNGQDGLRDVGCYGYRTGDEFARLERFES